MIQKTVRAKLVLREAKFIKKEFVGPARVRFVYVFYVTLGKKERNGGYATYLNPQLFLCRPKQNKKKTLKRFFVHLSFHRIQTHDSRAYVLLSCMSQRTTTKTPSATPLKTNIKNTKNEFRTRIKRRTRSTRISSSTTNKSVVKVVTMTSGNGDAPSRATIFWDLDDCLYKNDWTVANLLTERIEEFTVGKLGLKPGYAYDLSKKYGTCLKGMMVEKILDEKSVDEYLLWAHDVPLEKHIGRDEKLRDVLAEVKAEGFPMYIFTASARHHAEKCLELLGISDMFIDIIDVRAVEWATKHDEEAYERAMAIAGVKERERCVFIDDSTSNIKIAKKMGWHTILCGTKGRDCGSVLVCAEANHIIETAHEFSAEKHVPPFALAAEQPSK